jgi:hypothetical protein
VTRFIGDDEARELRRRWRTQEWSPDGRYRVEAEYGAVWVVSADGTERRRVASTELNQGVAWSPDGTLIAIGTEEQGLHVVKPDGSGLRSLPGTSLAQFPTWSPDGSWIAFEVDASSYKEGSSISVIRPDGSELRALTRAHQGPDQRNAGSPAWVDNRMLVFTAYQRGHDGPHKIYDIHRIGVDGQGERRVTYQCHLGTRRGERLFGSLLADKIRAFAGNDLVHARDGVRDEVSCGPGRDRVLADRRDRIARDCERVSRR